MKNLDDNAYVSSISIPGTHNSLSTFGGPLFITAA